MSSTYRFAGDAISVAIQARGFSAGLAYSVRRSEAFGTYLIDKQELFNDSFESADGWYLYEEMPREGEKGGLWGRRMKVLEDAALKVVGL